MKFAILGCGPAGLMVAHALARDEADFTIYSQQVEPSRIGGAQYLHIAIPGLTSADPQGRIYVCKRGTAEGYASKVGRTGQATSWSKFENGFIGVWNLRDAYEKLWLMYSGSIEERSFGAIDIPVLYQEYDAVISTIPKPALCLNAYHTFGVQLAWIRAGGDLGVPENTMTYDGTDDVAWYRSSNLFESQSKEYNSEVPGARLIRKPLWNDCDCNAEVFCFGRYGCYERRWLTSDAYTGARDFIRTVGSHGLRARLGETQRPGPVPDS